MAHFVRLSNIIENFASFKGPNALKPLVLKMNQLLNIRSRLSRSEGLIMSIKQKIDNEFKKYNMDFGDKLLSLERKLTSVTLNSSDTDLININNELLHIVEYYDGFRNFCLSIS